MKNIMQPKIVYFLIIAHSIFALSHNGYANITDGLVAHFAFDGNPNDSSVFNNQGFESGNINYVAGVKEQAVQIGDCNNPGHIRVPNSDSLKFQNTFTVTYFVRLDSNIGMSSNDGSCMNGLSGRTVFAKDHDRSGYYGKVSIDSEGTFTASLGNNAFSSPKASGYAHIEGSLALNKWVHVSLVINEHEIIGYINGVESNRTINQDIDLTHGNTKDLYIGKFRDYWYPLGGSIDDFRLYDRALSATEIQQIANPLVSHKLEVIFVGDGSGTTHFNPNKNDCTNDCSKIYEEGTEVTLTASAAPGNVFTGWSGVCEGIDECAITLDHSKGVIASFAKQNDLSVNVFSYTDYPNNIGHPNIFWVSVENPGSNDTTFFNVNVAYTAGAHTNGWDWDCGDIPDGVTCQKATSDSGTIFTLSMEAGKQIHLMGSFTANSSNFDEINVVASVDYAADNNFDNNQDSQTIYLDPTDLPKPENATLLLGTNYNASNKDTIIFTHGWQSTDPKGCDTYGKDQRIAQLGCFAQAIWTGSNENKGQAAALITEKIGIESQGERLYGFNRPNRISKKINTWQFIWEGAFTHTGMESDGYIAARKNVYSAGVELARKLITRLGTTSAYEGKIQFVGHSLGTAVNAYAIKYFMNKFPKATIQMTVLDHPNRVDRILGMSAEQEKRWGFDKNFFANVIPAINDKTQKDTFYVDNYFSCGTHKEFGVFTAGVGTKINGSNVYNHELLHKHFLQDNNFYYRIGLHDPNDVGGIFFLTEGSGGYFDNDHSGVHQWYRWTMWPSSKMYLNDSGFKCQKNRDPIDGWNKVLWGSDFHHTLNPCASGFAFSILQDNPIVFPVRNGENASISPTADFNLIGSHTNNYCTLQTTPLQIRCLTSLPKFQKVSLGDLKANGKSASLDQAIESNAPYSKFNINIFENINYLSLEFNFQHPSGDEFVHLMIDGQIVWSTHVNTVEPGTWSNTYKIPVFIEKGQHEVMLVFNGMQTDNSSFEMKNLHFYKDTNTVFPWPMFLPAITGAK